MRRSTSVTLGPTVPQNAPVQEPWFAAAARNSPRFPRTFRSTPPNCKSNNDHCPSLHCCHLHIFCYTRHDWPLGYSKLLAPLTRLQMLGMDMKCRLHKKLWISLMNLLFTIAKFSLHVFLARFCYANCIGISPE